MSTYQLSTTYSVFRIPYMYVTLFYYSSLRTPVLAGKLFFPPGASPSRPSCSSAALYSIRGVLASRVI